MCIVFETTTCELRGREEQKTLHKRFRATHHIILDASCYDCTQLVKPSTGQRCVTLRGHLIELVVRVTTRQRSSTNAFVIFTLFIQNSHVQLVLLTRQAGLIMKLAQRIAV